MGGGRGEQKEIDFIISVVTQPDDGCGGGEKGF